MKTFSNLVKENNSMKTFKANVNVSFDTVVFAENEGSAGEDIDKMVDSLSVSGSDLVITNYQINNIEEINNGEEIIESLLNEDAAISKNAYNHIIKTYEETIERLKDNDVSTLNTLLKIYFTELFGYNNNNNNKENDWRLSTSEI